jgi:methylmalonyl-CoA mutase N-terminal domain/subunit
MIEGDPGAVQMMPQIIEAVKDRCTLGEISAAFLEVWGAYTPHV